MCNNFFEKKETPMYELFIASHFWCWHYKGGGQSNFDKQLSEFIISGYTAFTLTIGCISSMPKVGWLHKYTIYSQYGKLITFMAKPYCTGQ
jgi:hypothetical protein